MALNLKAGQKCQLSAQVTDQNSQHMTNRVVTWASSDLDVATVDSKGMVTAVADGNCDITASCEGEDSPTLSVVVDDPVVTDVEIKTGVIQG